MNESITCLDRKFWGLTPLLPQNLVPNITKKSGSYLIFW